MDQKLIGEFISTKRKEKGLTQKELADKLNISEKTISKWETGHGLPEVSNMQPLCKELDITVTELLNGEETKKIKEDKVVKYIEYKEKKTKKKLLITLLLSTLIILVVVLGTYFFNSFNRITIFELSGESEHFAYNNMLFMKSNIKELLIEGNIEIKDNFIEDDQITYLELKAKDMTIFGGSYKGSTSNYILEDYGYGEYFDDDRINNINDWNLEITYKKDGKKNKETIKLNNTISMKNNKLFFKKVESINEESSQEAKEIQEEIKNENLSLREILIKDGFKPTKEDENYLIKKTSNKEIEFKIDDYIISFSYHIDEEKEYPAIRFRGHYMKTPGTIFVIQGDSNYDIGFHYNIVIDTFTCKKCHPKLNELKEEMLKDMSKYFYNGQTREEYYKEHPVKIVEPGHEDDD